MINVTGLIISVAIMIASQGVNTLHHEEDTTDHHHVYYIGDLVHPVPYFDNSPSLDMDRALQPAAAGSIYTPNNRVVDAQKGIDELIFLLEDFTDYEYRIIRYGRNHIIVKRQGW